MARFAKSKGAQASNKKVPQKGNTLKKKGNQFKSKPGKSAIGLQQAVGGKKKARRRHTKKNDQSSLAIKEMSSSSNVRLTKGKFKTKDSYVPVEKIETKKKKNVKHFPGKKSKKIIFKENEDKLIVENGQKYRVSKSGQKLPWIDLHFEENDFMTKYKNAYIKRDMVEQLESLRKSMEEKGVDEKQISYMLLVQEKKAHIKLKRELLKKRTSEMHK